MNTVTRKHRVAFMVSKGHKTFGVVGLIWMFVFSSSVAQAQVQLDMEPWNAVTVSQPTEPSVVFDQSAQPPVVSATHVPTTQAAVQQVNARQYVDQPLQGIPLEPAWDWTVLPDDLLYKAYVGSPREPRLASEILHLEGVGAVWELRAGARIGLLRFGTPDGTTPEGWQLDVEGAAFPRLNFDEDLELDAVDFRVGVPLTYRDGPWQFEFELYHLSAHVGDEFLLRPSNAGFVRRDYLRDAATFGVGYYQNPDLRYYAEIEYAFNNNDGSEPVHMQFGIDYVPVTNAGSFKPAPFFAINGLLREEVNFGGGLNVIAGFVWSGAASHSQFRAGVQYFNGQSFQLSFFDEHEELLGVGIWYDF